MEYAGIKRRRGRPSKYLHVWCMDQMKRKAALRQQDSSSPQSENITCGSNTDNTSTSKQAIKDLQPKGSKKAEAPSQYYSVTTTVSALATDRCDSSACRPTPRTHSKCSNHPKQMVSVDGMSHKADSYPEIRDTNSSSRMLSRSFVGADGRPITEIAEEMHSSTTETRKQPNGQVHKQGKSRQQSSTLQQLLQQPSLNQHPYRYASPRRNLKREIVPLRRRRRWMSVPSSDAELSSNTLRVFYEKGGRCFEEWAKEQKRSGRRNVYEPYLDVDPSDFFLSSPSFEHPSTPSKTTVSKETSSHLQYGSVAGYLQQNKKSPSLLYKVMKEYDELNRLFSEEDPSEGKPPSDQTEENEPLDLSTKSAFRMEDCDAYSLQY